MGALQHSRVMRRMADGERSSALGGRGLSHWLSGHTEELMFPSPCPDPAQPDPPATRCRSSRLNLH